MGMRQEDMGNAGKTEAPRTRPPTSSARETLRPLDPKLPKPETHQSSTQEVLKSPVWMPSCGHNTPAGLPASATLVSGFQFHGSGFRGLVVLGIRFLLGSYETLVFSFTNRM